MQPSGNQKRMLLWYCKSLQTNNPVMSLLVYDLEAYKRASIKDPKSSLMKKYMSISRSY